jgi:hypothetical protein
MGAIDGAVNLNRLRFCCRSLQLCTSFCSNTRFCEWGAAASHTLKSLMAPRLVGILIASVARGLERRAASQIEYLKAENRPLRSRLGRRCILFSNAER